jgi:hypothetical protein
MQELEAAALVLVLAPARVLLSDPPSRMATVTKNGDKNNSKKDQEGFGKDRRRKHHHFLVTVSYADGEKFGRVYTDKDKAARFADRQRRSPVVKSARVTQVS